jgi:hypothetical protein
VSNKDVKQDALDNLADALTEDILNTPDDELLREVEEDYGDPRALANKFDQILERAEKPASPQVRSSVLDLPISVPGETIRWVKGLGSRLSEFLSSLRPRTLAWSAIAAAVVIFVQAAVITDLLVKERDASSGPSVATAPHVVPRAGIEGPTDTALAPSGAVQTPAATAPASASLSDEEIAALVAGGRQLMVAGNISNARLVLQQAAEAGNATAALELGATYDPIELAKLDAGRRVQMSPSHVTSVGVRQSFEPTSPRGSPNRENTPESTEHTTPDISVAQKWYQKAKDLGSTEAAGRLERLSCHRGTEIVPCSPDYDPNYKAK